MLELTGSIIGIDPSANSTGIVVLGGDATVQFAAAIRPKNKDWSRILAHDFHALCVISSHKICLGVIEGYSIGSRGRALHLMVEVGAAYRLALSKQGIPWISVAPSALKKFVTGDGAAKKKQMRGRVKRVWGFEHKIEDVVEAYALARLGLENLKDGNSLNLNEMFVSPVLS